LRPQRASWAVWLALVALVLQTLVPIHLALDLDEALDGVHCAAPWAGDHGLGWRLLALAAGHDGGDGNPECDHRHPICPAYAALGALGGFATVAPPLLSGHAPVKALPAFATFAGEPGHAPVSGYRSRAPPRG
jgi:hypothetical protein